MSNRMQIVEKFNKSETTKNAINYPQFKHPECLHAPKGKVLSGHYIDVWQDIDCDIIAVKSQKPYNSTIYFESTNPVNGYNISGNAFAASTKHRALRDYGASCPMDENLKASSGVVHLYPRILSKFL